MMDRRTLLRAGLLAGGGLVAPMLNRGRARLFGNSPEYAIRALDLVQRSLVIDMLGLVTLDWRKQSRWLADPASFTEEHFYKAQAAAVSVVHPAVHFPAGDPARTARQFFVSWTRFLEHQDRFLRIDRGHDLIAAKTRGQIGVVLGLQNSNHLRSLEDVDRYYDLGQRISQLTYNHRNHLGSGCLEARDHGLTKLGAAVIQRMNETGMAIDVSHCGPRTTMETIEASDRPVLITHANCAALTPGQPRCKSDEALRLMARKGGVIGITSIRAFVRRTGPVQISHLVDHFDHVARVAGIEHAGLGTDTDLDAGRPEALLHPPQVIFQLTEALLERGFSPSSIELILGGNFSRALREIWT
jgi:membrane dipeptidase